MHAIDRYVIQHYIINFHMIKVKKQSIWPYVKPQLIILFIEDSVYLPSEERLQEYILNENGILYQGSWDDITTMPWNFGQVTYTSIHIRSDLLKKYCGQRPR